jgi:hypothetical protein
MHYFVFMQLMTPSVMKKLHARVVSFVPLQEDLSSRISVMQNIRQQYFIYFV